MRVCDRCKTAKPEIQTGACVLGLGVKIRGITYELCQHCYNIVTANVQKIVDQPPEYGG